MGLEMLDHFLAVVCWGCEAAAAEPLACVQSHSWRNMLLNSVLEQFSLASQHHRTSDPAAHDLVFY